jgi:hypothetical protein
MSVIIVVGDFGTGKTTLIKNYLLKAKGRKVKIFALVRNDYKENVYTDFKKYVYDVVNVKDTFCVIDEAKAVLPKKIPDTPKPHIERFLKFLINARKLNNFVFIVFHALHEIPIYLIGYADRFMRGRTNDLLQYQKNRFMSFPPVVKSIDDFPTLENFEFDDIKLR